MKDKLDNKIDKNKVIVIVKHIFLINPDIFIFIKHFNKEERIYSVKIISTIIKRYKLHKNIEDIEDILHEILLHIIKRYNSYKDNYSVALIYLDTIFVCKHITNNRKQYYEIKKQMQSQIILEDESKTYYNQLKDMMINIRYLIDKVLTDLEKKIFLMYLDGFMIKEIADEVNLNINTTRTRIKKIKEKIGRYE